MTKTQLKTVSIVRHHEQPHLSKGQKTFNALIKQIEKERAQLAAWEAIETPYKQKYAAELAPLFKDSEELQIKMLQCLDKAFAQGKLSKAERRKLAALITDTVQELLLTSDNDEIKAIFNNIGLEYKIAFSQMIVLSNIVGVLTKNKSFNLPFTIYHLPL